MHKNLLEYLCQTSTLGVFEYFISKKIKINIEESADFFPYALTNTNFEIVVYLIEKAKINLTNLSNFHLISIHSINIKGLARSNYIIYINDYLDFIKKFDNMVSLYQKLKSKKRIILCLKLNLLKIMI